jgi:hypothetical protein
MNGRGIANRSMCLDYRIGGIRGAVVNLETPADVEHLRAVRFDPLVRASGFGNGSQRILPLNVREVERWFPQIKRLSQCLRLAFDSTAPEPPLQ